MGKALSRRSEGAPLARPILKWAGGKTQLLEVLEVKIPANYGRYIEPFFGGGALFFSQQPADAVIADSNPELVNLYQCVSDDVEAVIEALKEFRNEKEFYYDVRAQHFNGLEPVQAAARTIFLNKTAFNGLYRVNKKGGFNVPFGSYKKPNFRNAPALRAASAALQSAKIILGDYKEVLREHASEGDFIFLDPPYLPVSEYSDFKRYTKEQFYEEDHQDLADEVKRLNNLGCHVVLTNSNHPLVHELYKDFEIEVHQTKRNVNSRGNKRTGEDVIVHAPPRRLKKLKLSVVPEPLCEQAEKYPPTRYMGAKGKLLTNIRDIVRQFECDTVLDLFSGSGVVSYMLKTEGKEVISNDYMALGATLTRAMVENNTEKLPLATAKKLMVENAASDRFVQETFEGIYFTTEENILIDNIRANIKKLRNPYRKAIAVAALTRACTKKRPRGIFTYTGHRYDDGRRDLKISLEEQFLNAIQIINEAVFDNGRKNSSRRCDALTIKSKPDLVYMDPPYYSPHSDNEYVRRYHFVEGIACDWQGVEMQWHTKTRKFKSYPTPFSSRVGAHDAFDKLIRKFKDSVIVISYSSNSLPTLDEMVSIMSKYKETVEVISLNHRYSIGNQNQRIDDNNNQVKEYLFVGF